jgi:hypothetical protein
MKYEITIKAKNNVFSDQEFSGEFGSDLNEKDRAIAEAKDFYASSLDTTEDCIEIISVKEII